MLFSRVVATLFATVLASGAVPTTGRSQDVCANPTFRIPDGSALVVQPRPGKFDPQALTAGTYVARPDLPAGCACDLAVAVAPQTGNAAEGFVALMRGNENGTFTLHPGALLAVDGSPVAMAGGRVGPGLSRGGHLAG